MQKEKKSRKKDIYKRPTADAEVMKKTRKIANVTEANPNEFNLKEKKRKFCQFCEVH